MINEVVAGISVRLDAEFGYEIHMEEIKQDLQEPCFFIASVNPTISPYPSGRYRRENQFVIQYFPKSNTDARAECNNVAERMLWCLEEIEAMGGRIRGCDMNYKVVDGVLNFFVNYNFFVRRQKEETAMGAMNGNMHVKG